MGEPFAENLRLLCSHYASVAEVCRRIGINQQQFNKYLSGASTRMLYEMAKKHDEWPGEHYDGSSCRGAIRGWHNMGVCQETEWPYKKTRASSY